uniref:Cnidarian restricted protein n=1 Tax=Clytia hemisphaerica TaxID=252671 RepID=A0A7M5WMH8_9CNID
MKISLVFTLLWIFFHVEIVVSNVMLGRYCTRSETYNGYTSEIRTRARHESYHDGCCTKSWGSCVGCDRYRYATEYYYVSVAKVMTRQVRFCCPGYVLSGSICVPETTSPWSAWGSFNACEEQNMWGPWFRKQERTCSSSCPNGANRHKTFDCRNTYIGSGAIDDPDVRPQCYTSCKPLFNIDGHFSVNFWKIEWTKKFDITVFTKKAANGQSDIIVYPKSLKDSPSKYEALTTDTSGMSDYTFTFNSSYGDLIVDHAKTKTRQLTLSSTDTGKKNFKVDIEGKFTANPSPDSETYVTVIFKVKGAPKEIFAITQKKATLSTDRTALAIDLRSNVPSEPYFLYPGSPYLKLHPSFNANNRRIFKVFFKIMIPKAVMEINLQKRETLFRFNQGITIDLWESAHYSYAANKMSSLQVYAPSFDPASTGISIETYNFIKPSSYEIISQTYLAAPTHNGHIDVSYCKDASCSTVEIATLRIVSTKMATMYDMWAITEPFRVKHIASGLCWENKDSDTISAASKCKDVFQFKEDSKIIHLATGIELRHSADYKLSLLDDGGMYFVMRDHTIMKVLKTDAKYCVLEENGEVKITNTEFSFTQKSCENDTKSHIKILPDFSKHYSKLSMKSWLHVTTSSQGQVLLVCEPAEDLAMKSNCRYSFDTGTTWKEITPFVSQLKFFVPSEDFFYGYCNKVKYFCTWNIQTLRLDYIEESLFNEKLLDLNTQAVTGLDDMTLVPQPSADGDVPTLGLSSLGIHKQNGGGSWDLTYIWLN